jgi:stage III sporulation protein AG
MGFWDRWSRLFDAAPGEGKRFKTGKLLFILLAVGLALLLFNSFFSRSGEKEAPPPPDERVAEEGGFNSEEKRRRDLAEVLSQIEGVSEVEIYLTPGSAGRRELVADREQSRRQTSEGDREGGTREVVEETERQTYVILRDPHGNEAPLVVEEGEPSYRGVLVVARGVDNYEVKGRVIEALQVLLGLPAHRITVLPRR